MIGSGGKQTVRRKNVLVAPYPPQNVMYGEKCNAHYVRLSVPVVLEISPYHYFCHHPRHCWQTGELSVGTLLANVSHRG